MDTVPDALLLATALSAGLVAGAFFVFSVLVMPALGALPTSAGIAAMQSVNRTAVRPAFLTALFGTAALCLLVGIWELLTAPRVVVAAAVLLYLVGTVVVTIAANVPLNDGLARLDPSTGPAEEVWRGHLRRWTAWNTLRSLAALAASACMTVPLAG